MKIEIICPLLTTNTVVEENGKVSVGTQPVYCMREMCAWWNEGKQSCAVAVLAKKK